VLEAAPDPGGALRSGELTLPGHEHDLFATNLNLFLASRFFARHGPGLAAAGFSPARSSLPFASAFPDGSALGVSTDLEATLSGLEANDPADAAGWRRLQESFQRLAPVLFALYGARAPSLEMARLAAPQLRRLGAAGAGELARLLASSTRELVESELASEKARALIAPWGMHLDFGPDVAGGAVFPFLETFADQSGGMAVAAGGASRLVEALVALLVAAGASLRTSAPVRRLLVEEGRVAGVELAGGERIGARLAVLASVTPTALAGELLDPSALPPAARRALLAYRYGPATMMVHLALSGPIPWAAGEWLASYGYVHLAPYLDDLARTYSDSLAGRLPPEPLLVVGQTSTLDPGRAPPGRQVVWIQVRTLPTRIREDPDGDLAGADWDEAAERYSERVLDKLERYAPGVRRLIEGKAVLSPRELERRNANLVGGDSLAGSMHLRQNFLLRPTLGFSGYATPIPGLSLIGASTWPGAGLNAVSGEQAARAVIAAARRRRSLGRLHLPAPVLARASRRLR